MMFPGARFGLVLGSRRLADCVGADRAQGLIGGVEKIDAQQGKAWGLLIEVCEPSQWPTYEAKVLAQVLATPADARASILRATRRDTREQDLHDLVQSASALDIKSRLAAYLAPVKLRR
jgi:enoyl-CoA hydratase/carnithine racemase